MLYAFIVKTINNIFLHDKKKIQSLPIVLFVSMKNFCKLDGINYGSKQTLRHIEKMRRNSLNDRTSSHK